MEKEVSLRVSSVVANQAGKGGPCEPRRDDVPEC